MDDKQLDQLCEKVMYLPGMTKERESFLHLEEAGGEFYMKFMSDGGVTDDHNGLTLHALLKAAGVEHEYEDGRKFFVQVDEFQSFVNSFPQAYRKTLPKPIRLHFYNTETRKNGLAIVEEVAKDTFVFTQYVRGKRGSKPVRTAAPEEYRTLEIALKRAMGFVQTWATT